MQIKEHRFGPSETIGGIIRKYNNHAMDSNSLNHLYLMYNVLNDHSVPHIGDLCKIPVMPSGWKV